MEGQRTKNKEQNGQALVLVLLSLAVVVTIVLFILSRSVTDIAVSDSESQSVSAFSAAEAGVEQALVIGSNITPTTIGNSSYSAAVTYVASGLSQFVYPVELNSGDAMTLWFKSQDASPNFNSAATALKICWGKNLTYSDSNLKPAIEATIVYETTAGNPATAKIFRATADPFGGRSPANSFTAATTVSTIIAGQAFPFCRTLNLSGLTNLQFASIRMFYNTNTSQPIGIDSTNAAWLFPTQGITIDSSGTSGQSSRKVEVFQGWPEIPSQFLFGLYSPTGLTK